MSASALVELFFASFAMLCLARLVVTGFIGDAENGPFIARWGSRPQVKQKSLR
ncbi:hypothetical protein [Methylocystis heyeri]|uniref:Uncharacterized protein n=1 Tax=Methylocystis heyeri TaxID=391905 RepID=A0A6B8KJ89_9HYPH|nr:hypothetical protein [Methylocystis heyeri]QGM46623.1 hypothetical protein H2LOC_013485 [Methylocystis heyeri]